MERNEAIERIKTRFDKWALDNEDMEAIQTLIPELAESEDERILNALITHIRIYEGDFTTVGVTRLEMLDWLEKQKKQKPTEDTALQKAFVISKKDYTLEEKCDASDYADTILPTSVTYGENDEEYKLHKIIEAAFIAGKKMAQHPAEWSEEDEDMIQDIIASIDTKIAASDFHEMENWLKSLRPQPKQEWSEENEKKLGKCIDAVSGYYSPEDKQELKNWLKSLRPQPHWKPSEEQMEALRKVTYKIGNSCFGKNWANDENLHSLYVALQKLM